MAVKIRYKTKISAIGAGQTGLSVTADSETADFYKKVGFVRAG